jgi:S-sulfo-L-cysteine synthase (O-acetyl-L-serine-dependent)
MKRTIEQFIGETPLARLQRLPGEAGARNGNVILAKLEGNNPAGSVKDRPAIYMVRRAEERGTIKKGDVLIEATSRQYRHCIGHGRCDPRLSHDTGHARAPLGRTASDDAGLRCRDRPHRRDGRHGDAARDLAERMRARGQGIILDQFANADNPLAHFEGTGPEIWEQTRGRITHFVSSMGTTGTIMGCSRFLKEKNPSHPDHRLPTRGRLADPGHPQVARGLPSAHLRQVAGRRLEYVSQADAEDMTRRLAREEGIFAGISSGGAMHVALRISAELRERGDCLDYLRSWRPLSVDRRISRLNGDRPHAR